MLVPSPAESSNQQACHLLMSISFCARNGTSRVTLRPADPRPKQTAVANPGCYFEASALKSIEGSLQALGKADLGYGGELGYISLVDI